MALGAVGKILARGVGTICPSGEYHSGNKKFELFVCCPSDARELSQSEVSQDETSQSEMLRREHTSGFWLEYKFVFAW